MAQREKMGDDELAGLIDGKLTDSISYDATELSSHRTKALQALDGELPDVPAEDGRSAIVSRELSSTLDWMMPGLMRVFLGSSRVVEYQARRAEATEGAKQATDGINYRFLSENAGYEVLRGAIYDGLTVGNGLIKHYWDMTKVYETESYTGVSDLQWIKLTAPDDVEVLEHTERPADESVPAPDDAMGGLILPAPMLHDLKIKKLSRGPRMVIEVIPPEDFLIDRNARALTEDDAIFCAHRTRRTRSWLIEQGHDRELVEGLAASPSTSQAPEAGAREKIIDLSPGRTTDKSTEAVDVFECYMRVDYDGDGVAEWRKIVMAGGTGKRQMLANDEWGGDLPFTDLKPDPVPHRYRGRSLFDQIEDIQRINTVLLRGALDNMYAINRPQREAVLDEVENPDELTSPTFGGIVWTKKPDVIKTLDMPFIADKAFAAFEKMQGVMEFRTGVSPRSMALDMDALQNQTATATNAGEATRSARIEMVARNLAEIGLKRLFRCLLRLTVKNQDKPFTIQLRGKFVEVDPSIWDPDMDVEVNTGLGAGSRDKDLAITGNIAAKQEQVIGFFGPDNPFVPLSKLFDTYRTMAELAGVRNAESYFPQIDPAHLTAFAQQNGSKPDPKLAEVQAKIQGEQARFAAEMQLKQADREAQRQADAEERALKLQLMREEAQAKLQLAREEMASRIQADRDAATLKAHNDFQLRLKEMELEERLKMAAIQRGVGNQMGVENITRPE